MEIATGLIVAGVGYLIGTKAMVQSGGNPDDWKTSHPRAREYKDLTEWPNLPITVKRVRFEDCDFSEIPDLSSSRLSDITFYNGKVPTELPRMPETLTHLLVGNCDTDGDRPLKISNLPSSLQVLDLSSTLIDTLPELPSRLRKLVVSHTENSRDLSSLPRYMRTLEVGGGVISNLSTLEFPEGLKTLVLKDCGLTEISYIPDSVTLLYLGGNQLESLCFPSSLKYLNINDNKFSSIERLPSKLESFSATGNELTKINAFPYTLRQVFLTNNELTKLPAPSWNMKIHVIGNQFPAGYIRKYMQTYKNRRLNIVAEPIGLSTREPLSSSEWYNMCNSETNIISQNPWAEEGDNSNVVIITKDARDNCYNAKDLEDLVKNTDLHVRKWIERPGQTNNAASMAMGYGFMPDPMSDVYVKLLPEYGSAYIKLDDIEKMLYDSTKRYFVTSSLGNHRVGNLSGHYEVSGVHGQGPPFPELLTLAESSVVPSIKVREAPVVRPTETTAESRAAMAARIAASRARQAAINMDDDDDYPDDDPNDDIHAVYSGTDEDEE